MDREQEARQWLRQQLWWEERLEELRVADSQRRVGVMAMASSVDDHESVERAA